MFSSLDDMLRTVLTLSSAVIPALGWQGFSGPAIQIPDSGSANLSPYIDPSFQSFAIEQGSVVQYATADGDGHTPNSYSINMFNAITNRTGGQLMIRLGGTSADYANITDQPEPALPVAHVEQLQDSFINITTLGRSYWDVAALIPDARFVVQVPLAPDDISETLLWATTAYRALRGRIEAIEIGNEANLYPSAGLGPDEGYTGRLTNETYAGRFAKYLDNVTSTLDLPRGKKVFQAVDTASGLGPDARLFDVPLLFDSGMDRAGMVKSIAWHYYQASLVATENLARDLMNHSAIVRRLDYFKPIIQYLNEEQEGLPFLLSEVGNSLNGLHNYAAQAVLGSALWQVDFECYCAAIGISRVYYQQIMHAGYDLWLPVSSDGRDAQTYAAFYGRQLVGDFFGNSGGTTQVAPLDIASGDTSEDLSNIVAYGAWEDGKLSRVAIVNFNFWDSQDSQYNPSAEDSLCPNCTTSPTERPSTQIELDGLPDGVTKIRIEQLNSDLGAHADGKDITYEGTQWTKESDGKPVRVKWDCKYADVYGNSGMVTVEASSAVVVHLE